MSAKKVILATDKPYSPEHENLLHDLYERRIELFCVWGVYCEDWETAMDLYVTDLGRGDLPHHITTTSHAGESLEEVVNMAEYWAINNGTNEIEIIRI